MPEYILEPLNISEYENISEKIRGEKFERKPYFSDRRFSKEDCQLLFALRTRMIDCKTNFSHLYGEALDCRLWNVEDSIENEDHLLVCPILNDEENSVVFSDVYENIDKQYLATQAFKKVVRRRKVYLDLQDNK